MVDVIGPADMQVRASADRADWAQLIREYQLETT
jgi:hypothetical protein